MRKAKILVTLVIALSLMLSAFSTAAASGPSGGWASGIACQNLDTTNDATVTLSFYPQGSSTAARTYTATIPAGGSKNWLTTSGSSMEGFPANFLGSGVVSSTTALACNVNTQSTGTGTTANPLRVGTSSGFDTNQVGSTMYVPQALRNVGDPAGGSWNSYIAVQNTTDATVTVNVTYYNSSTGAAIANATDTASLPAYSTKVFYQNETTNLPNGFNGSAKVVSTSALAVTLAIYQDGANASREQFLSFNGAKSGSTSVFVPRFVRNLLKSSTSVGYNSGLAIQNVGTQATDVTITFSFPGLSPIAITKTVQPNASWLPYAPSIAELAAVDGLAASARQGSAVITSSASPIIATVNEDNKTNGQGSTYNAVNSEAATKNVFIAQFTKNAGQFSSGFQISNTTNTAGTCTIDYVGQPGFTETVTLPASGSITRWALSGSMGGLKNGYNAAVKVTCNQNVTGIVNMSAYGSNSAGDSFTQTSALNQ